MLSLDSVDWQGALMGRFAKVVVNEPGVDSRATGYYSTPDFVADFITKEMLHINPNGEWVLDPCVGKEELLNAFAQLGKSIDSMDIYDFGTHALANFKHQDFLDFFEQEKNNAILGQKIALKYDYFILNPPYNCHETDYIRSKKIKLTHQFKDIGTLNLYSMFISATISMAKEGAIIGIITCDSFLQSHLHKGLRDQILSECTLHGLFLCPTDLFWSQKADVRTCIIILEKGRKETTAVKILNRPLNTELFRIQLEKNHFQQAKLEDILLTHSSDNNEFVIGCPLELKRLFDLPRLGDLFRCITGISTGDDKKYISSVEREGFSTPFYKNPGSRRFFCEPDGFLTDNFLAVGDKVKNFMVRNKAFLKKEGITCSSMGVSFGACYLPTGSVYGVNANIFGMNGCEWWLLAYLNSSLVTYLVRGIFHRTNMITSGYVSRIPVLKLDPTDKAKLEIIAKEAVSGKIQKHQYAEYIQSIDAIIFKSASLSDDSLKMIADFIQNPIKAT